MKAKMTEIEVTPADKFVSIRHESMSEVAKYVIERKFTLSYYTILVREVLNVRSIHYVFCTVNFNFII